LKYSTPKRRLNLSCSHPIVSRTFKASIRRGKGEQDRKSAFLFIRLENGILTKDRHFFEEPTPLQGITLDFDKLDFEEALGDTLNENLALK
jgi:hypothetical protein